MKNKRCMRVVFPAVFVAMVFVSASCAQADSKQTSQKSFSGWIQFLGGWTNSTDPLRVVDDNEQINDSDGEVDSYSRGLAGIQCDLNYRISTDTLMYFGTPVETARSALAGGIRHTMADDSQVDVSLLWKPLSQVWKDPYVTGADREETDALEYGAAVEFRGIRRTGLILGYRIERIGVDSDLIGECYDDLQRDGTVHTLGTGYAFHPDRNMVLMPKLEYSRATMDGDSNSYNGYSGKVKWAYNIRHHHRLNVSVSVGRRQYNEIHPIYDETRKETLTGVMAGYTWLSPFGWDHLFINIASGANHRLANIDFFDSRTYFSCAGVGYRF